MGDIINSSNHFKSVGYSYIPRKLNGNAHHLAKFSFDCCMDYWIEKFSGWLFGINALFLFSLNDIYVFSLKKNINKQILKKKKS